MAAAMSALPVTLLLVTVLLAFSQPAWGYRRGLSTTGGLITHNLGRQLLQEGSDNPCGQFPADDPFDGARNGQTPNWRQPCRDEAGVVQFCCSSGTTQCACPPDPPTAAGPFTCFNYNAGNSLNANTGAQCGFTLPGSSGSPSPTSATPSPTSATPGPTSATPSPTTATPSPTSTTPPSTSLPTSGPGGPCISSPRGSPGADGTCGNDPAGQAYNLCETMAGIQFCCPMGFTCPTADPVTASNPNFALQVYCQAEGPCTESPTSAPGTSPPTNAPTTSAPTTNAPATSAPATIAPTTSAPATNAPTTSAPATNAPTTSAPATNAPTTSAPTSGPPSGCQTVPSSGSPGVDGTCGYDPSGQAFNLCSTAGGIQFCCPQGFICPIAGSVAPSGSSSALQVFCQVPGPCGY